MKTDYSKLSSIELMNVILKLHKKIMESEIALSFYPPSALSQDTMMLKSIIDNTHEEITLAKTWYKIQLTNTTTFHEQLQTRRSGHLHK